MFNHDFAESFDWNFLCLGNLFSHFLGGRPRKYRYVKRLVQKKNWRLGLRGQWSVLAVMAEAKIQITRYGFFVICFVSEIGDINVKIEKRKHRGGEKGNTLRNAIMIGSYRAENCATVRRTTGEENEYDPGETLTQNFFIISRWTGPHPARHAPITFAERLQGKEVKTHLSSTLPSPTMRRRVKNLLTLVSLFSLASLVPCRPTEEEDRFDLIQGESSVNSLPFSDGSLKPQLPDPGSPLSFDAIDSAFFNSISPTSPNILSDSSVFAQVAPKTICPGKNRYPFCCGSAGCFYTTACETFESLCCCTVDPNMSSDNYYDCELANPGSEDALIEPGIQPNSFAEFFAYNDPNANLVLDDTSESFPNDISESSFWCQLSCYWFLNLLRLRLHSIDVDEILLQRCLQPGWFICSYTGTL